MDLVIGEAGLCRGSRLALDGSPGTLAFRGARPTKPGNELQIILDSHACLKEVVAGQPGGLHIGIRNGVDAPAPFSVKHRLASQPIFVEHPAVITDLGKNGPKTLGARDRVAPRCSILLRHGEWAHAARAEVAVE